MPWNRIPANGYDGSPRPEDGDWVLGVYPVFNGKPGEFEYYALHYGFDGATDGLGETWTTAYGERSEPPDAWLAFEEWKP